MTELERLIKKLEIIRDEGTGRLNFSEAVYILALEIKEIKRKLEIDSWVSEDE